MAADQHLAVICVADRQARLAIVMGRAARHPPAARLSPAKGLGDGPASKVAQLGHLSRPLTDQRADILNSPHRDSGAKLDRFRKAAGLNTVPPGRLADRDRAGGSEKVGEADKAGFGQ
jgi:hypothetical protein